MAEVQATDAPTHELVMAFQRADLPLHPTLREMLQDHPAHRTERRGCGYTQATRFLSEFVNRGRDALVAADLGVFEDWPRSATEAIARQTLAAGWSRGWRALPGDDPRLSACAPHALAQRLSALPAQLDAIDAMLEREESRLLLAMIRQLLLDPGCDAPALPHMPEKPQIGSCSQAEEFFLEIAHGRIRRGGRVTVFVDARGQPVLVEKIALGESHSAMVIGPVSLCGVALPDGALCALRRADPPADGYAPGIAVEPVGAIAQARFLRLTTLSLAPKVRRRAFAAQLDAQVRGGMCSPLSTTLEDLRGFAHRQLSA